MGLLSKANLLEQNKRLAFSYLINKYDLKQFAIFSKNNEDYLIINSLGFDGISIINSTSTSDFWNGLCKEEENIYFFEKEAITPLLQFFSFNIKDEIQNISIIKIDGYILMICNNQIKNEFISDFKKISFTENNNNISTLNQFITKESLLYKISMDFEEAIETYLVTKSKNNEYTEILKKSLATELMNRVFFYYNDENASVRISDYSLNTVFICKNTTSEDLLLNHIILNFKEVLDSSAELINLNFNGSAESFQDIIDFLQAR